MVSTGWGAHRTLSHSLTHSVLRLLLLLSVSIAKQLLRFESVRIRALELRLWHSRQTVSALSHELSQYASEVQSVAAEPLKLHQKALARSVLEDAHLNGHGRREIVRREVRSHRGA